MKFRYRLLWWLEGLWLWLEGALLNLVTKTLPPSEPIEPDKCKHKWYVDSYDYEEVAINVMCFSCNSNGVVKEPTEEEWMDAFGENMGAWRGQSPVTWLSQWD